MAEEDQKNIVSACSELCREIETHSFDIKNQVLQLRLYNNVFFSSFAFLSPLLVARVEETLSLGLSKEERGREA